MADFEHIVRTYQTALLRYALRLVRDSATAEDVVQNAFVKLIARGNVPSEATPQLAAWLYRVVHNEAIDHIRRDHRRARLHQDAADISAAHKNSQNALMEDAVEALECLSERERELVVLQIFQGMSYAEMASAMGLSASNVGVILHGAMKKLAARIRKQGGSK